jgi:predicted acetyltransferase
MYKVEPGNPDDVKQVDKILWRAFEIDEKYDEEKREPWDEWIKEGLSRSFVIKDKDNIVANITLNSFSATIRGSDMIINGVGAVATEPTHRRQGMIKSLFETSFLNMKDKGEFFSMLDPFNIEFYRKLGYANAETMMQYRFTPSNIIQLKIPSSIHIREAVKGDNKILMDLQRNLNQNGSRVYLTPKSIEERIKSHNCYIIEENGKPAGWFKLYFFRDKTNIDWSEQTLTMIVSLTFFYNNYIVLNAMFDFLGKFDKQVKKIRLNSSQEVPVANYIKDRYALETLVRGSMMVRIIDLEKYCNSIKIPNSATEPVVMTLVDGNCPWNSGTYEFIPENGKLIVKETDSDPEITVNDQQLSRMIGGLNSVKTLQQIGTIDCTFEVANKIEKIFPKDPIMSYLRF